TLLITPPTAPPNAGVPASFTFAVTAASSNGSAVRDVTVDWGDGTAPQDLGVITGNAVVAHVYANAGTFTIVATLTDSFGNVITARSAVSVIAAPAPTIIITPTLPASCSPATSAIVNLQIQVSVPTGIGVVSVTVNFGDGQQSNVGGLNGTTTIPHPY